ncbi:MAG TPA: hypothetical protein VMS17_14965 [Gemmataceae bacterium]|nr:hypothetical protein [Gemmataceae bacterium]
MKGWTPTWLDGAQVKGFPSSAEYPDTTVCGLRQMTIGRNARRPLRFTFSSRFSALTADVIGNQS